MSAATKKHSLTPGRFRVLALMAVDLLCLLVVWYLLVNLYRAFGFGQYHTRDYWHLWPIAFMYLSVNVATRLYHGNILYPAMPLSPVEEFRRLFASSLFAHLLLLAMLGFLRTNLEYSRFIIVAAGVIVGLLAQLSRNLLRSALFRLRICQIPVALAGGGKTAQRVEAILRNNAYVGFDVVLRFDDAHLRDIVGESRRHDVKILLACQDERFFRAQLREFTEWFSYMEYLPRAEVFPVFGAHAVLIDGIGGLEMMNQRRMKALRWEKNVLDFLLALAGVCLTLPFFAVIPVLIKLTSPGPVLYRARRLGKSGREFDCLKFRSMYADADRRLEEVLARDPARAAEFAANFKLKDDPRVTRFGRFLRKTSLDELPQLFNVMRGEMAFIGPRPIVAKEIPFYGSDYEVLRTVRPGITGLWQCSGRSDVGYERRVALDTYYILNWSPWMDIWIFIKTIGAVLSMRGAV
ncbi:MAG: exopolysaccharide biosynthesis polyprenyl glycosylphosphotransferase [Kiritimatiellae bacterium]|nr:exopolysaccharide biosynthesis polyprenyl glycosylphosphotransferase [Kiritimatiellia bacterium]